MGDIEPGQSQNDFEVQVSDLDEPDTATNLPQPSHLSRKSPFSLRRHRLYLILLNSLMILAAVLILASTTSVRILVNSAFIHPAPSPTATLPPGVDLFYIQASPGWGHLLIDGHPTPLPTISTDSPVRFTRGQHLLFWQADPFLVQRCIVSVPSNPTDTCNDHKTASGPTGLSAWVITFSESLTTLSGQQRTALLAAAQAALDTLQSTDTVRPGEHYTLAPDNPACQNAHQGYQCYATAVQPLRATLSFRLDTNEASAETCINADPPCMLSHQDCRQFCAEPGTAPVLAPASTRQWDVLAPVLVLWTFTAMDGQLLARDIPDASSQDYATGQMMDESLVQLNITWGSLGWHVALPADLHNQSSGSFNPVCAAMQANVEFISPPADTNGTHVYLQWHFVSGTLPASGCLAVGTPQSDGLMTPMPTRSPQLVVSCLYRFGVLLTVNSLAQRSGLLLPRTDAYEQQLARQLAK